MLGVFTARGLDSGRRHASSQDRPQAAIPVSFLDEIPERAPWTLIGCARSRSIHDWFYGDDDVPMVDMCPRKLVRPDEPPGPVITKCCLLEDRVSSDADLVIVPWGASLAQIREGLELAIEAARPASAPGQGAPAADPVLL